MIEHLRHRLALWISPNTDTSGILSQAHLRALAADRAARLSDATLTAFAGSGDIGKDNLYNGSTGGPLLVLGDARSMKAVADSAVQGLGMTHQAKPKDEEDGDATVPS